MDDEPALRRLLEISIRSLSFEVETAGSLADAFMRMKAFQPDAVMVDMSLPDGSGYAFARSARELAGRPVRVVLMSGVEEQGDLARALGGARFLAKPFSIHEVSTALGDSGAKEEGR